MLKITMRMNQVMIPRFSYNIRRPSPKPSMYEIERVEYKYLMNQYRSRLVKSYWEEQKQTENNYIDQFLEKERLKAKRHIVFNRSQIVKQTYIATQQYQKQQKQQKERDQRVKKYLIEKDIKKMNREQILNMLNEESKNWINLGNLESKLVGSLLLPDTITDEITYYHDLEEQALLYETANFEELDKRSDQNKVFEWKNRLAMPIFQRINSLIKYLRQDNPLSKLEFEWDVCRSILLQDKTMNEQELIEQLSKIDFAFNSLQKQTIEELESNPVLKLKEIHKQLIRLFNLNELWDKYITLIKLDTSTAQVIIAENKKAQDIFKDDDDENPASEVVQNNVLTDELEESQSKSEQQYQQYISADEKHTDSDEDIDLDALLQQNKLAQAKQQQQENTTETEKPINFDPSLIQDHLQANQFNQTIEQMLQQAEKQYSKSQFDDVYSKNPMQKVFYNQSLDHSQIDIRSIFQGIDLEQLFPPELLQDKNEPFLEFKTIQDIQKYQDQLKALHSLKQGDDNVIPDPEIKKMNNSIMSEVYSKILKNLTVPQEYEQLKQDTLKLVQEVGEQKIQEAGFLLKLWNYYK